MNKVDAAAFLSVSTRTIERYAEEKRIGVSYIKQEGRRSIADYNEEDLNNLKIEIETEIIATSPVFLKKVLENPEVLATFADDFLDCTRRIAIAIESLTTLQALPHKEKLALNLAEASFLSGFSKNELRHRLKSGELNGRKLGRGWKILRSDLESWVKNQFI